MLAKIGIIILNWNGWQDTLNCLASLRQVDYPKPQLDIIVVDNGSRDDSVERLRQQQDIVLLELSCNVGFAAGSNIGIRRAISDGCNYVLLLNNDTLVPPEFLMPLLEVFAAEVRAGVVSPKIRYEDPPDRLWYAGGNFLGSRLLGEMVGMGQIDAGQHDRARVVDFAVGCCMLIGCSVFEQVGYLDERFFFYHEDVDFSLRTARAGFKIFYQPASVIMHRVSHSTRGNLPARAFHEAQSRIVFFRKHIHGSRRYIVIGLELARLVRIVAQSVFDRQVGTAVSYLQGLIAGFRNPYSGHPTLR